MILRTLPAIFLLCLGLVGCQISDDTSPPETKELQLRDVPSGGETAATRVRVSNGQVVYVPCYSHIRLADGRTYKLAINLSIRNTSFSNDLTITAVDYHDSSGRLVKHHADDPIVLGPLATADFFVTENDKSGGSGANFMVEWVASKPITEPIVEAVMVGTGGGQGVSFVSVGRWLRETE